MMKSYFWLIGILITALLGILILQANYTLDNYRLKTTEFREEVNQLFAEAVAEETQIRRDSIIRWFRKSISDTSQILLSVNYDEEAKRLLIHLRDREEDSPYTSISFEDDLRKINELDAINREITIDRLTRTASTYLEKGNIYYWTEKLGEEMDGMARSMVLDTSRLQTLYDQRLRAQQSYSPYQLIRAPIDSSLEVPFGKKIQTEAFPIAIMGAQEQVLAAFSNPFSTIIRKAAISIIGSLLIILLTAGSFFIMFRIILRQKKLAQIKDDFIDNISHELQTPIATLRAANEGLEKYHWSEASDKAKQYLQISRQQIDRLSQMVDQTLMNSIYERKSIRIQPQLMDIEALLQNILSACRLKNPEVRFSLTSDLKGKKLLLDRDHLNNCLENLLDNAVKHNHGQKDLQISIQAHLDGAAPLKLIVADNGKGIPLADQARIFDKFYRIDDRQANGYGIGLFYVKSALQAMDGSISLTSKPGQGAQFTLKIPLTNG